MIDGLNARMLEEIDSRAKDLQNAYTPGFVPSRDDEAQEGPANSAPSLSALSIVAPPDTFFAVQDAQGRRAYTRSGDLGFENGMLRTPDGSAVLGQGPQSGPNDPPQPLHEDPVDVALRRCTDERIDVDGTVSYARTAIDPQNGKAKPERVVVGRVLLARFPGGTPLSSADGRHVSVPSGVEPVLGLPNDGTFATLTVKRSDRGTLDIGKTAEALRESFLALSALQTAQFAHGKTEKTAMDLIK
jgi:hypothetical protein